MRAAPVEVAQQRVRSGVARAVLANSGCANACTGEPGFEATLATTLAVAHALGIPREQVLPASTGVIGALLPADTIVEHVPELVGGLDPDKAPAFAEAIMTTDRWIKFSSTDLGPATLVGIAKGAGMIDPDVVPLPKTEPPHATMLVFFFTDAKVERMPLELALVTAANRTFNACSVDGDTSTNDTVLALASGVSGHEPSRQELAEALTRVGTELARSMVLDGEGAEHAVDVHVRGLRTVEEARLVARTVATSLLVKTALHGRDANWGRLLAAAGRAGVPFLPEEARIRSAESSSSGTVSPPGPRPKPALPGQWRRRPTPSSSCSAPGPESSPTSPAISATATWT